LLAFGLWRTWRWIFWNRQNRRDIQKRRECRPARRAALRILCLPKQTYFNKRQYGHGKRGHLHYPDIFLSRKADLSPGRGPDHLPIKGQPARKNLLCLRLAGGHDLSCPPPGRISSSAGISSYGFYINVSRGLRQKEKEDAPIP